MALPATGTPVALIWAAQMSPSPGAKRFSQGGEGGAQAGQRGHEGRGGGAAELGEADGGGGADLAAIGGRELHREGLAIGQAVVADPDLARAGHLRVGGRGFEAGAGE